MSLRGEKGEDEDGSGGTGKDELVASPVPFLRVGSVMGSEAGLIPIKSYAAAGGHGERKPYTRLTACGTGGMGTQGTKIHGPAA
jgi:hypothetical protein